jgi:hypothetical protein
MDLRSGYAGESAQGRIKVNGSIIFNFGEGSTSYVTHSDDLSGFNKNELITIELRESLLGKTAYLKNFRICGIIDHQNIDIDLPVWS